MKVLIKYFHEIKFSKAVLWCYLIWYITVVYFYFDPSPKIWINSIGISAVVGTGLVLSVTSERGLPGDHWQIFRLYLMPFCVSSFSALIKERGFIVVVSPRIVETMMSTMSCVAFLLLILTIKRLKKKP